MRHNHFTRDTKPKGQCPRCDEYYASELQRAHRIAQETIQEAPEDEDLSLTFAEFKRRLKGPRP